MYVLHFGEIERDVAFAFRVHGFNRLMYLHFANWCMGNRTDISDTPVSLASIGSEEHFYLLVHECAEFHSCFRITHFQRHEYFYLM